MTFLTITHPHIFQMWWIGMTYLESLNHHRIDLYPIEFHPIFCSKSQIEWKQIHYGCISQQWMHYMVLHHPNTDANKLYAQRYPSMDLHIWAMDFTKWWQCNDQTFPTKYAIQNPRYLCNQRWPTSAHPRSISQFMQEELMTKAKNASKYGYKTAKPLSSMS